MRASGITAKKGILLARRYLRKLIVMRYEDLRRVKGHPLLRRKRKGVRAYIILSHKGPN